MEGDDDVSRIRARDEWGVGIAAMGVRSRQTERSTTPVSAPPSTISSCSPSPIPISPSSAGNLWPTAPKTPWASYCLSVRGLDNLPCRTLLPTSQSAHWQMACSMFGGLQALWCGRGGRVKMKMAGCPAPCPRPRPRPTPHPHLNRSAPPLLLSSSPPPLLRRRPVGERAAGMRVRWSRTSSEAGEPLLGFEILGLHCIFRPPPAPFSLLPPPFSLPPPSSLLSLLPPPQLRLCAWAQSRASLCSPLPAASCPLYGTCAHFIGR